MTLIFVPVHVVRVLVAFSRNAYRLDSVPCVSRLCVSVCVCVYVCVSCVSCVYVTIVRV